jgi:23S rRNA pseudouridine2605 synthase
VTRAASRAKRRGVNPAAAPARRNRKTERVQKVLARAGVGSRRQAEALIAAGRIRVGGRRISEQGVQVDPIRDAVSLDGRRVSAEPLEYVLFHKPRQVMCTMRDPLGRKSVVDFLRGVGSRVVPVGRLDYQTSGVLLLTNDGDLSRSLTHPSGGVQKEYVLKVKGRVDEAALTRFRARIEIAGTRTSPAEVRRLRADENNTWLLVRIHEGKNRQVRRLAEYAGYRVMRLTRSSFGDLSVDDLRPGEWRFLSASELRSLRALISAGEREEYRPTVSARDEGPEDAVEDLAPMERSRGERSKPRAAGKSKSPRRTPGVRSGVALREAPEEVDAATGESAPRVSAPRANAPRVTAPRAKAPFGKSPRTKAPFGKPPRKSPPGKPTAPTSPPDGIRSPRGPAARAPSPKGPSPRAPSPRAPSAKSPRGKRRR